MLKSSRPHSERITTRGEIVAGAFLRTPAIEVCHLAPATLAATVKGANMDGSASPAIIGQKAVKPEAMFFIGPLLHSCQAAILGGSPFSPSQANASVRGRWFPNCAEKIPAKSWKNTPPSSIRIFPGSTKGFPDRLTPLAWKGILRLPLFPEKSRASFATRRDCAAPRHIQPATNPSSPDFRGI